ncbi:hypothetical protein LOD99_10663 [Oopsacas minuta]|uniref:Uncharacterized protein n=1 Tax=Oopsacas minuta TaxID=111878 RepID=A0AAV7KFA4_9METZ|nr:hypothetical protein LOD99_10663 [Oopsacas minuta]
MRFLINQRYIQEYSLKTFIPLPETCPILSYTSEGSICIDMDSLVTDDEVFLKSVDDEGFFEAELPKPKTPNKSPEILNNSSEFEICPINFK